MTAEKPSGEHKQEKEHKEGADVVAEVQVQVVEQPVEPPGAVEMVEVEQMVDVEVEVVEYVDAVMEVEISVSSMSV